MIVMVVGDLAGLLIVRNIKREVMTAPANAGLDIHHSLELYCSRVIIYK